MDFAGVVRRRRMVRSFDERPVPEDVLERILDHGRRGPSAGYTQGTELIVLVGLEETRGYWDAVLPEPLERMRDDFSPAGLPRAPVLILPMSNQQAYLDRYAEPDKGWTDRDAQRWLVPYWDVDAAFAAMLMLLSAVNEGLGALFFGVPNGHDPLREALGYPEHVYPIGVIALGYRADDDRPIGSAVTRPRRPLEEVVHRGHW